MDTTPESKGPAETPAAAPPENLSPKGMAAVQGIEADTSGEWKDLGIVDVPVTDLPMPEGVSGPADFDHHISYEDALSATRQLPEVQAEVNADKTRDDFWAADRAAGLDYAHGKERVYDLYYGSDPVTLSKEDGKYSIESGRHRVYAAKVLGLDSIPARVHEKLQ